MQYKQEPTAIPNSLDEYQEICWAEKCSVFVECSVASKTNYTMREPFKHGDF